jgi:sugar fermentation stimulation protein A
MQFSQPLIKGTLIQRYKRFLADVRLEKGEVITAYCANPGAMLTLKTPGSEVWLSPIADHFDRKLKYDWQLVRVDGELVGVNTALPNHLVQEALSNRVIVELSHYTHWQREVAYGHRSRVDFLLKEPGYPDCYLEVKNVNHKEGDIALFPDCKTVRGARHLGELGEMVKAGNRAVVLYVVQRQDCDRFGLAAHLDPGYVTAARKAEAVGVEFLCYSCAMNICEVKIVKPMPQEEL